MRPDELFHYEWTPNPAYNYLPQTVAPISQESTEAITLPQPVPVPTEFKPEPPPSEEEET